MKVKQHSPVTSSEPNSLASRMLLCCVGAYNLEVARVRHAVTMKSRHYDKPDAFQPGPGQIALRQARASGLELHAHCCPSAA